jgi:DegV family protein with EDD domain
MAARDIAIITDSTCDIPSDLIEKHNITIVPHTIIWDNQQLLDRVEIQPEEFYQKIREGASIPTTSQATEQDFLDHLSRLFPGVRRKYWSSPYPAG